MASLARGKSVLAILLTLTAVLGASGLVLADNNYGAGTYGGCQYGSCGLTLASSGSVNLDTTPASSGRCTIKSDDVSVETDNSAGYTLLLNNSASATALTSGGASIAASSGSLAAPQQLALNRWGYRVDGVGGFGTGPTSAQTNGPQTALAFAGVPSSSQQADTIASTSSVADPAITTKVWYGVCANLTTPSGTYSSQITYTAITN